MKSSNCLTRSLHHWDKYGGIIMYGNTHAKIIGGNRYYFDNFNIGDAFDIKEYGMEYFLSAHKDFLNEEEIEILTKYFENKAIG